jgi:hypothetical protein
MDAGLKSLTANFSHVEHKDNKRNYEGDNRQNTQPDKNAAHYFYFFILVAGGAIDD